MQKRIDLLKVIQAFVESTLGHSRQEFELHLTDDGGSQSSASCRKIFGMTPKLDAFNFTVKVFCLNKSFSLVEKMRKLHRGI